MRKIFSGILFVSLLISVFLGPFYIQSAKVNASSRGDTVQAASTDWWPMFHHDPSHTGASTSRGPTTNNTLWTFTTGDVVLSSPAVVDGFVYVGSHDGKVYCLRAATGALVWNYTTGVGWLVQSSPAVVDGLVYVGAAHSHGGKVYCLNATTGAVVWSHQFPWYYSAVYSSPTVVDGFVYVGSCDKNVYCLNAATGAVVWNYTTTGMVAHSSPAVVGGLVYVGSMDRNVYCLNAANGAFVWNYTTGNSWQGVQSSPAVVGGLAYVGGYDGKVYCLNAATGALVWNYTIVGDSWKYVWSSPAVVGGFVYVGSSYDNNVHCLNAATGALVWNYTVGGVVLSSPAVVGGFVYVGSHDKKVYCLNATSGAPVWSYMTDDYVYSSPAVVDAVYVGSADGRVYAIGEALGASISPTSVIMDVGQSRLFNSKVSGGTLPYSYQWCLNGAPVSGATGATWTFTPASTGSYNIYLNVTDAVNDVETSNTATAAVNSAPSASISPSAVMLDVGQSQLFTSTVSGGTLPYAYQWYLNDVSVTGANGSTWMFTANSSDFCLVYVNVTDGVSFRVKSNIASINQPLSVTVSPSSVAMNVSQSQQFTSNVSGGVPPYTYQWSLNGAPVSGATSNNWTFTPTSLARAGGEYNVTLTVKDTAGNQATDTIKVTVTSAEASPTWTIAAAVVGVAAAAAALAGLYYLKRRKPQAPTAPAPPT